MNDDGFNQHGIICHCSGTTQEKVKALVENGITDLDILSISTGVCSGCDACGKLVLQLIAEYS